MSKRAFNIAASLLAVIIGALIWANISLDTPRGWDVCYPMVNQGIEWAGAGYNGIRGK